MNHINIELKRMLKMCVIVHKRRNNCLSFILYILHVFSVDTIASYKQYDEYTYKL